MMNKRICPQKLRALLNRVLIRKPKTKLNRKKEIDWEEERECLKEYLREKYPLTIAKIEKIISERSTKYINIKEYQSWFLKNQEKKVLKNMKNKSNKLSNTPKETKSLFDLEAKQSNVNSEEDENDDDENNEDI